MNQPVETISRADLLGSALSSSEDRLRRPMPRTDKPSPVARQAIDLLDSMPPNAMSDGQVLCLIDTLIAELSAPGRYRTPYRANLFNEDWKRQYVDVLTDLLERTQELGS